MRLTIRGFLLLTIVMSAVSVEAQDMGCDSLKALVANTNNDSLIIKYYHEIGSMCLRNNLDSCQAYYQQAYQLAKKKGYHEAEANSLNRLGVHAWYGGDLELAEEYFRKSYNVADSFKIIDKMAGAVGNLGLIAKRYKRMNEAEKLLAESIELFKEIGDSVKIAKYQVDIVSCLVSQSKYEQAMETLLEATRYFERHGMKNNLIFAYYNLGDINFQLRLSDKSILYYQKGVDVSNEIGSNEALSNIYVGMGMVYERLIVDLETAIEYYEKAREVSCQYNRVSIEVNVTNNLANIFFLQKNFSKALTEYHKALALQKGRGVDDSDIPININIGASHLYLQNYDSARLYLNKSLSEIAESHNSEYLAIAYLNMFRLDSAVGNHLAANEYLKEYYQLNDSLARHKFRTEVADLTLSYETEQKEQLNQALQKENALQEEQLKTQKQLGYLKILALLVVSVFGLWLWFSKRKLSRLNDKLRDQRNKLETLNTTKDKFFSILAHDLKSPFNSLLGFLEILHEDFYTMSDDEKVEIIDNLYATSTNTFELLINLLDWSRSQRGRNEYNPEQLGLQASVDRVFEILKNRAATKEHHLVSHVKNGLSIRTDKMMFETILLNLVNNSIKFTNPGGTIEVGAEIHDHKLLISVKDNGIGIPAENIGGLFAIDNQYRTQGTNNELGTGLGLIICKEFVDKMGGEISVVSTEGVGSEFSIVLPL